jgi:hypothetical protein
MRRKASIVLIGGGLLLLAALGMQPVLGQEQPKSPVLEQEQPKSPDEKAQMAEGVRLTREVINHERQALITRAMDLTPAEMQRFWPLYREYRRAASKVGDQIVSLINTYADNQQNMTDKVADKLLTEFVRIEEARARLKAQYLPKFKKVLPPRKVVRFYQIENKLDTAILADVSEIIPLVR